MIGSFTPICRKNIAKDDLHEVYVFASLLLQIHKNYWQAIIIEKCYTVML